MTTNTDIKVLSIPPQTADLRVAWLSEILDLIDYFNNFSLKLNREDIGMTTPAPSV